MQNDQGILGGGPPSHLFDASQMDGRRAAEPRPPAADSSDDDDDTKSTSLLSRIHGGAPQYRRSLFRR